MRVSIVSSVLREPYMSAPALPTMSDVAPDPDLFRAAAQILDRGGVVAYPTETVWGLAARPAAAAELYRRKGREANKPLQLSCLDAATALALAVPSPALLALSGCWPGPLTVVTPGQPERLRAWGAGAGAVAPDGWLGLRVPAHPVALALLRAAGGVLATTSLNPSGQAAASSQAEAEAYALADLLLPDVPDAAGQAPRPLAVPSTVLRLPAAGEQVARVLREGGLGRAELAARLAPLGVRVETL